MLSRRTTFVLGAGASYDLNLPIGDGLQERIVELLKLHPDQRRFVNERIWNALVPVINGTDNGWPERAQRFVAAAEKIGRGMPVAASIDNFLHTHRDDGEIVFLGKMAIALAILEAESSSYLSQSNNSGMSNSDIFTKQAYKDSWYAPFTKMLTSGTTLDDPILLFKNLRFVVFNYDRCLEIVLLKTIEDYFGINKSEAVKILRTVDIIHPYGSVGGLLGLSGNGVAFGNAGADLCAVSNEIKTFTESAETDVVNRAKFAIAEAEVIVFMGFGFLPQNVELLMPGDERKASRIHATTLGFSLGDQNIIGEQLRGFVQPSNAISYSNLLQAGRGSGSGFIDVQNGTCRDLIGNHRMRLMAG